ncbi:MAG: DUF898 domain-containing protein [Sphingobium sp.]|nr:DUF898 domain-containing protein [Sphingobium sp.]MBP6110760.1 DUF898 domain-containing protein [Sphingobium sp.]MBP8671760.1 DUF898 domain-containing protein [Sphingobium sp.]MBP9157448.1 DUF898 domain-containing protein [Sphingobium sp.]MCC6481622.1 DUF898 domain-containing protein [Sphingomonadaceae bacterium]
MMDEHSGSAFAFEGSWKEYAPIAFSNLLLTIVTLGFYRFWATARTRRYLWSRTRFIDDQLEWTGTGIELFKGFLMVLVLLGLPFLFLQFGVQALVIRGMGGIAALLAISSVLIVFYLVGVARFRALRYRLSRTYWHGIRGGANDGGWKYGWSYIWKNVAGAIPIYLLMPRAMMSLWNERWNKMSFGPYEFASRGDWRDTFKRYLLIYLLPLLLIPIGIISAGSGMSGILMLMRWIIIILLLAYVVVPLILLSFYAKFFRVGVGGVSLQNLEFRFNATTWDWIKLFLIDILLVIITLGIGLIFLQYRHWKFFITHLEAYGDIDLDALTQSNTRESRHGEGLLDAMDVGAF